MNTAILQGRERSGVLLAARYAFPPNRLGYCGKPSFPDALAACLACLDSRGGALHKKSVLALERELRRFRTHLAFLKLIARENGLEPFDYEVVRAFWTGNRLLENVRPEAMRRFVERELFRPGSRRADSLSRSIPEGILPHHSFNVLYVNFVTDKAERSLRNFDSCCITWGQVRSVSEGFVTIDRNCISRKWGRFCLSPRTERVALIRNGFRLVDGIRPGDTIAVHWGMAIERLGQKDVRALAACTERNIRAINDGRDGVPV